MLDVKNLIQAMLLAWPLIGIFILGVGIYSMKGGWLALFWQAVSRGGWAAVGFIIFILIAVVVSFNELFTNFHRIFFSGDTWLIPFLRFPDSPFPHDVLAGRVYCDGRSGFTGWCRCGFGGKQAGKRVDFIWNFGEV